MMTNRKYRKPNAYPNQAHYLVKFKNKVISMWYKKERLKDLEMKQDNRLNMI
jgi:hypothetical protein